MYKIGAGNDKQGKDAGNRTLCPYRNFSQAIMRFLEAFLFQINRDNSGNSIDLILVGKCPPSVIRL